MRTPSSTITASIRALQLRRTAVLLSPAVAVRQSAAPSSPPPDLERLVSGLLESHAAFSLLARELPDLAVRTGVATTRIPQFSRRVGRYLMSVLHHQGLVAQMFGSITGRSVGAPTLDPDHPVVVGLALFHDALHSAREPSGPDSIPIESLAPVRHIVRVIRWHATFCDRLGLAADFAGHERCASTLSGMTGEAASIGRRTARLDPCLRLCTWPAPRATPLAIAAAIRDVQLWWRSHAG